MGRSRILENGVEVEVSNRDNGSVRFRLESRYDMASGHCDSRIKDGEVGVELLSMSAPQFR